MRWPAIWIFGGWSRIEVIHDEESQGEIFLFSPSVGLYDSGSGALSVHGGCGMSMDVECEGKWGLSSLNNGQKILSF